MTSSISQEEQTNNAPATTTVKGALPAKKARVAKQRAAATPKAKPASKATRAKQAATARRGSKTAKILDLLKRPGGVTLKKLMSTTGWQPHSVRGFLSAVGKKRTPVESFTNAEGERAYRLSSK